MDNFFQKLRDIQKKERSAGNLSEIDDSFYDDASNYLQQLLKQVDNNPLSLEAYQLRDAQRITTEICDKREFKLISTAATNVQRSHDLFKGHKKDSTLYEEIPYNTTPEEEEFYKKIVNMMVEHRQSLMEKIDLNKKSSTNKIGFKPKKEKKEVQSSDNSTQTQIFNQETEKEEIPEKEKTQLKSPVLDETQIAMMFGQAPDDILMDENNQPVKQIKKDISTPFKGPKPPETDSIVLQNEEEKSKEETKEPKETTKEIENNENSESIPVDDTIEESTEYMNTEELVVFKDQIQTDILDINEKTYGPFLKEDVVLLPQDIVKVLLKHDVIRIIH